MPIIWQPSRIMSAAVSGVSLLVAALGMARLIPSATEACSASRRDVELSPDASRTGATA
jgi:hypothetical protein